MHHEFKAVFTRVDAQVKGNDTAVELTILHLRLFVI